MSIRAVKYELGSVNLPQPASRRVSNLTLTEIHVRAGGRGRAGPGLERALSAHAAHAEASLNWQMNIGLTSLGQNTKARRTLAKPKADRA